MKKTIAVLAVILCSFKTGEKTAQIKVTEVQYKALMANAIQALNRIDSVKIVLSTQGTGNEKLLTILANAQQNIVTYYNFTAGQVDTVFKK